MKQLKTYLLLFFGMAFFGSATSLSKLVAHDFPVFIAGALRVGLAFLVLMPFIKISAIKKYTGKDLWILIGISLIGVLAFTAFMLYGMQLISGVTGSVIMSATPALTALLSVIFFKDKLNWKKVLAIILAVSGVIVLQLGMHQQNNRHSVLGIILVSAAICCESTYTLLGKALTKNYPPEDIAAFSAIIAFIGFIPAAAWQYHSGLFEQIPGKRWLELLVYGGITMGVGSVLWYKGIQQVEGSTAAAFMGVMPVSALALSYVLLGESFRWLHLAGFMLVFAGVLLIISVHREMMSNTK